MAAHSKPLYPYVNDQSPKPNHFRGLTLGKFKSSSCSLDDGEPSEITPENATGSSQ